MGGAPWSEAPHVMPPYLAAAGVPSSHQPGMVNGAMRHNNSNSGAAAGAAQEELPGGFSLTPADCVRNAPHASKDTAATGGGPATAPVHTAPSTATAPSGQQWVNSAGPLVPSPSPSPTPSAPLADGQGVGPASAVDLERGMTSPWQGPGDAEGDAATAAVATTVGVAPPPGLTGVGRAPEAVGAGAVSGGGGGVLGKEKRGGPAARPEGLTGAPERGQGVPQRQRQPLQQQQQQRAKVEGLAQGQVVSASPVTAEPLTQQVRYCGTVAGNQE